jgi:peptidyl-prolyl cis-trans isomerase D
MAAIGSIRKRSGLLVGVIGLSIIGFLLMDALNSNTSILRGGRKDTVGKVNGEKILYADFIKKVEDGVRNLQERMGAQGGQVNDEQRNMVRNQVWEEVVAEKIADETYADLGLNVTSEELAEITIGGNPHPYVVQSFTNQQTGQFDAAQVRFFIQQLDQDDPGAEPGTRRRMWTNFEKEIKKDEARLKYSNLVSKGLFVPTWLAQSAYNDQLRTVDFKYVQLPFADVKDEDIKFTDDDLKKYLSANSKKYNQEEESRKIDYVTFDVVPFAADTQAALDYLLEKKEAFTAGTSTTEDSLFVKIYSEEPFNVVYSEREQVQFSPIVEDLFNAPVRTVVGPFIDGDKYKLARITDRKLLSDSVRVSEIVFSFNDVKTQEEANEKRQKFDSVFTQLDSLKGNFQAFAVTFSEDQNSKVKAGDIGWVKREVKPKYYNDVLFYQAAKGKVYKTATQNELIIFMVTEDRPTKQGVQVAYLTQTIVPSPETERTIYGNASKFAGDNQTEALFTKSAEKLKAKTADNLRKNDFNVFGLGNARDLVRWAYTAQKGDVSSIMNVDKKYVVAILTGVAAKGLPDLDAVKDRVKFDYLREKKAELLAEKINGAKGGSIDELASKLSKEAVMVSGAAFSNPSLNGTLFEPNVAAAATGAAKDKLIAPVKGNTGVYAVQVSTINEPPKASDYTSYLTSLKMQTQGKAGKTTEVKKKLADVEDFRFDFF